jgi:hypothetical protein
MSFTATFLASFTTFCGIYNSDFVGLQQHENYSSIDVYNIKITTIFEYLQQCFCGRLQQHFCGRFQQHFVGRKLIVGCSSIFQICRRMMWKFLFVATQELSF